MLSTETITVTLLSSLLGVFFTARVQRVERGASARRKRLTLPIDADAMGTDAADCHDGVR